MTKDDIQNILKKINYPGFNRDIISFGMVKNISITDNAIQITLQINSENQEILNQLKDLIKQKLNEKTNMNILVNIQKGHKNIESSNQNTVANKNSIEGIKHIIAIASGKGGVGKSTIAMNLAATLSKTYKVGILDLDIYGPSLPLLSGLNTQPQMTENKKLIPLEKFNMQMMSFGFINSDNAPAVWRGPMVSRMTQQFFEDVEWGNLDYLILDLPPGTGDIQLTLVQKLAITGAIMVTTPQNLALIDVNKGADMFNKVNTPILGIIENMTHFLCPHCEEKSQIFSGHGGQKESSRLKVPLLGQIYLSPEIAHCSDIGTPFVFEYKNSLITKEYEKIALKIHNQL